MNLGELLSDIVVHASGVCPQIAGVTSHSQDVKHGFCFVAIPGTRTNGEAYIEEAIELGASVIVSQSSKAQIEGKEIFFLQVSDAREALSRIAHYFYDEPSKKLAVIGVTGTNGKTTTHWMIAELLRLLGKKCGRIGTLGLFGSKAHDGDSLTTPDAVTVHSFLSSLVENENDAVSMEVSSHALDQRRVSSVQFDIGIFSNLTRDHLDYHGSMEQYAHAKMELFRLVGKSSGKKVAVINQAGPWGDRFGAFAKESGCTVIGFISADKSALNEPQADILYKYAVVTSTITGTTFTLNPSGQCFQSPYIGEYNIENILGAILAVHEYGFSFEQIAAVTPLMAQVPGRLERVTTHKIDQLGPWSYVDYAHTPDAIEKAVHALKMFAHKKLFVIFGCGGDRDKGKRPLMFNAAMKAASDIVITSDNPRTEDPEAIISDILSEEGAPLFVEIDRTKAIQRTLSLAKEGDIILIAGKGHEEYQIIGTQKFYFSDQKIVREFYQ